MRRNVRNVLRLEQAIQFLDGETNRYLRTRSNFIIINRNIPSSYKFRKN